MTTIFEKSTRDELIKRINSLDKNSKAQWGKMNIFQMVKHNSFWNSWVVGVGNHQYKQAFIGKLFGKMVLRKMVNDSKPIDKNVPTSRQFKIPEVDGDLDGEKLNWINYTQAFETFDNPKFIHDFFGKMTKEQIGILAYKHSDHHLRQFGV
ncbi:MAG: DUF1569 domain-containing protein [Ginsengibacter sp.]